MHRAEKLHTHSAQSREVAHAQSREVAHAQCKCLAQPAQPAQSGHRNGGQAVCGCMECHFNDRVSSLWRHQEINCVKSFARHSKGSGGLGRVAFSLNSWRNPLKHPKPNLEWKQLAATIYRHMVPTLNYHWHIITHLKSTWLPTIKVNTSTQLILKRSHMITHFKTSPPVMIIQVIGAHYHLASTCTMHATTMHLTRWRGWRSLMTRCKTFSAPPFTWPGGGT